ncbi:hypothetical protein [Anaeromassilibacillus sp. An200]|uniref:hypothetical protein n=1 Tax=Anaeromassilibacillus sp. An200 TaxID=1965587 RepID=UPI0013A64FB5|nr:hypothetical protein [Anaeromassilibacillus sp. An200]
MIDDGGLFVCKSVCFSFKKGFSVPVFRTFPLLMLQLALQRGGIFGFSFYQLFYLSQSLILLLYGTGKHRGTLEKIEKNIPQTAAL